MEESREERLAWFRALKAFDPFKRFQAEMREFMDIMDVEIHEPKTDNDKRGVLVAEWQARATVVNLVDEEIKSLAAQIEQDDKQEKQNG